MNPIILIWERPNGDGVTAGSFFNGCKCENEGKAPFRGKPERISDGALLAQRLPRWHAEHTHAAMAISSNQDGGIKPITHQFLLWPRTCSLVLCVLLPPSGCVCGCVCASAFAFACALTAHVNAC